MKRKKVLFVLLVTFLFAACAGLTACGNKEKDVTLVGWAETTIVEANLGDTFTVAAADLSVKDDADNAYKVSYSVKQLSDGTTVTPVANSFRVESMGGYEITFTARISETMTKTRTVTITVADHGKPVINIGELPIGFVGQNYTFPVRVTDLSGETITPELSVFLVEGDTETSVNMTGDSFRPETRGTYRVQVTATDSSGNSETASADFSVRNAKIANAIDDFDDPVTAVGSKNHQMGVTDAEPEWIAEKDGHTGVVTTNSGTGEFKNNFFFKFPMTEEEVAATDFDYISFWIWIDAEGTHKVYNCNAELNMAARGRSWQYITLSRAQIDQDVHTGNNWNNSWYSLGGNDGPRLEGESPFEAFCRLMTGPDGFYLFYVGNLDNTTVYVDDILFRYDDELTGFTDKAAYGTGETVTLKTTVTRPAEGTVSYTVTDPDGNPVSLTENAFVVENAGTYRISAKVTDSEGIVSLYPNMPLNIPRDAPLAGEIESFDVSASTQSVKLRNASAPTYVADKPEGSAHGSVSFEIPYDPGIWPRLYLTPRQELAAYDDYNAIEVVLKLESALLSDTLVYFYKGGGGAVNARVTLNEWVTVRVPIENFRTEFDTLSDPTKDDEGGFLWFTGNDANNTDTTQNYITCLKIHSIMAIVVPESDPAKIAEFGNRDFIGNISSMESSTVRFIDQAAIDADDTLPALDSGYEGGGYAEIDKTNPESYLNYVVKPQCSYETYLAADFIEIRMYITNTNAAPGGTVPLYYFNTVFAQVPVDSWQSVKLPLSIIYHPDNYGIQYQSPADFFTGMASTQLFMLAGIGDPTVYVSTINLGNDPPIDTSIGDGYTKIDAEHITAETGTTSAVTFDGKACVKIVASNEWESIFVTPLKTYAELAQYTSLKITLYVETEPSVLLFRMFSQYYLGMNYETNPEGEFANAARMYYDDSQGLDVEQMGEPTNRWVDITVPMDWILKLYYKNDDGHNDNALMIMQRSAFTAIYISSITCIE